MPVTEEDGFVALLYLNNAKPRVWAESEIALIQQIAERTRTAIERRRAEAALRENEARLRFLAALADGAEKEIDADSVMAITTRLVGEHMRVSICAYADMEPDEDHFTIRGDWSAEGSPSIVGYYSLADFGRLAVEKLHAGLPLIVNDNQAELAPEEAQTFINIGIAATICMPLVKEGKLTALIAIHDKNPRRWTSSELALLEEIAERSWAHVERVRSEQAAERELAERRRAEQATGLGLSQVYGFVRQSSGNVRLYSEVDVGTSVKIYLPRFYGLTDDDLTEDEPKVAARGNNDEVVLVVEDDDRVRAVSIEALNELGYTVLEMRSPSEALRLLQGDQVVSLLFTDVLMPEMSGRRLWLIEQRQARPTLKVLYTTGYTRNAIVHNGAGIPAQTSFQNLTVLMSYPRK